MCYSLARGFKFTVELFEKNSQFGEKENKNSGTWYPIVQIQLDCWGLTCQIHQRQQWVLAWVLSLPSALINIAGSKRKQPSSLSDYSVLDTIGTGTFGVCRKVQRKRDGQVRARRACFPQAHLLHKDLCLEGTQLWRHDRARETHACVRSQHSAWVASYQHCALSRQVMRFAAFEEHYKLSLCLCFLFVES